MFYTIWVEHAASPTKIHSTLEEARAEAERLARKEGKTAYLLQSIAKCSLKDVVWENIE